MKKLSHILFWWLITWSAGNYRECSYQEDPYTGSSKTVCEQVKRKMTKCFNDRGSMIKFVTAAPMFCCTDWKEEEIRTGSCDGNSWSRYSLPVDRILKSE